MKDLKFFFLSVAITGLSFALITVYLIIPEFKKVITNSIEAESLRIAENLYPIVIDETKSSLKNVSEFAVILETERKKFNIRKIKVYSKYKEIIYSTDLVEVGQINPHIPAVKKGSAYSKLIEKGKKTAEGEKIMTYVVETYVPIVEKDNILGYFEIYKDASNILNSITKSSHFSLKIQTALLLALLIFLSIFILSAERYRFKEQSLDVAGRYKNKAIKNMLLIFVTVFIAEIIVMLVIHALRIESEIMATLYDSIFLSLLIVPSLYLFIFKPLNESIYALERSKEELKNSNKILNEIADGISESILLLTLDFRVIWANKAAIEEIGLSPLQIAGDYCYRLIHHFEQPCEPNFHPCPVKKVLETGKPAIFEHVHFDKDNKPINVEVAVYPIKDDNGKITKFVYISRKIG